MRMKHLVNLHDVEMAVVHDIKKRNCRRHTGGCRGCALFVDRESGLDRLCGDDDGAESGRGEKILMALYIFGLLVSWALACVALGLVAVFLSDKAVKLNREGRRRWQERYRRDEDE